MQALQQGLNLKRPFVPYALYCHSKQHVAVCPRPVLSGLLYCAGASWHRSHIAYPPSLTSLGHLGLGYSLRSGILITLLQECCDLRMQIRILSFQLHKHGASGSGALSNTHVEDLFRCLLCLLEELLHTGTSAVLQACGHRRHCSSRRSSRRHSTRRSTGCRGILRHILLLNHLHIVLSSSDTN